MFRSVLRLATKTYSDPRFLRGEGNKEVKGEQEKKTCGQKRTFLCGQGNLRRRFIYSPTINLAQKEEKKLEWESVRSLQTNTVSNSDALRYLTPADSRGI